MPREPRKTGNKSRRITATKDAAGESAKKPSGVKHKSQVSVDEHPSGVKSDLDADNPTLGFKDENAARRTMDMVKTRSLLYQYQVINTMLKRVKHHPNQTTQMKAAGKIFEQWVNVTYHQERGSLRCNGGFRPIVGKDLVAKLRPLMLKSGVQGSELRFVDFYINLKERAKLANQLVDEANPSGGDWEVERYRALCTLVPEDKETRRDWDEEELWDEETRPTRTHLQMLAWAWSPINNLTLARKVAALKEV